LDPDHPTIRLNGRDVSAEVRSAAVTRAVSAVSAVPAVRAALVRVQRAVIEDTPVVVVEGRDIGTVVAPDATVKVFLTAAPDARAQRRNLELRSSSSEEPLHGTATDLARRDALDSGRAISPLTKADDAVEVDTTSMTPTQAVETILRLVRERTEDAADR
jgi:cytidylate kinase